MTQCIAEPTVDDVRVIISTTYTDAQIEAIISDAALIAETCISPLPSARQTAILRWLTAHLIASSSDTGAGALASDKLGDAAKSWHTGALGKELKSTKYGLAALQLDPNGCLARIGKPPSTIQKV